MKIGILTYHRVINEGSVLQAYCSQQWLKSKYPKADVQIIDYRPSFVERREMMKWFRKKPPFLNFTEIAKYRKIDNFRNNFLSVTNDKYQSDKLQDTQEFIQKLKFDIIFVGSDTVWEVRENGGSPLAPNIYFLPNINAKKIGLAVSMDQTDDNLLFGKRADDLTGLMNEFSYIGYRDQTTYSYLDKMKVEKLKHFYLPDPSLLWDFTELKEEPVFNMSSGTKWAGVAVGKPKLRLQLTETLVKKGYKVINLLGLPVKGQNQMPFSTTYGQHLGIIANLQLMVTDRFHQSIMALRLANAPIVFIENSNKYIEKASKGRDLFSRLNIDFNIIKVDELDDFGEIIGKIDMQWRDSEIDGRDLIAKLVESSKSSIASIDLAIR